MAQKRTKKKRAGSVSAAELRGAIRTLRGVKPAVGSAVGSGPLGMTEAEKWRELCRFWRERTLALEEHVVARLVVIEEKLDRLSSMVAAAGERAPTFWSRVRARFSRESAPAPFDASEIDF